MRLTRDAAALLFITTIAATGCGKSSSGGDDGPAPPTDVPPPGTEVTPPATPPADPGAGAGAGTTPTRAQPTDHPDRTQPPAPPSTRPAPGSPEALCAAKWSKKSEIYKPGTILAWDINTTVTGRVTTAGDSTVHQQETVKSADADTITLDRTRQTTAPTPDAGTTEEVTWHKAEEIDFCVANLTSDEQPIIQVVDKHPAQLTVQAGTFSTNYVKQHGANDDEKFDSETWTLDGNDEIVVKTESKLQSTINGQPYSQVTKWELVQLQKGE